MDLTIIIIIAVLLIGMKIISTIWKSGLKEADEYQRLTSDPEFRDARLNECLAALQTATAKKPELTYKIARIYMLANAYDQASNYFKEYTKLEPNEAEGFAELAEALILQQKVDEAKSAIAQAIFLEPEYAEYRLSQLRIGLRAGDSTYAEAAANAWIKLDAARVKLNKRPHRWSPMYQIGPKEATPDAAIKPYSVALLHLKHETSAAQELIDNMNEIERNYFYTLLEEDELFTGLKEQYDA